eukprot:8094974-Prorocentrum_lima.AAC.1
MVNPINIAALKKSCQMCHGWISLWFRQSRHKWLQHSGTLNILCMRGATTRIASLHHMIKKQATKWN